MAERRIVTLLFLVHEDSHRKVMIPSSFLDRALMPANIQRGSGRISTLRCDGTLSPPFWGCSATDFTNKPLCPVAGRDPVSEIGKGSFVSCRQLKMTQAGR